MSDAAIMSDVKAEIRRRSDNFEKFFRNGQAAELVNDYYVDEPMMSAPDIPLMRSRAEILKLFEGLVQQFSDAKLFNEEVRASGDRAYELGRCEITDKEGNVADCRYVIIWRKVADGWRVETDFFAYGKLF